MHVAAQNITNSGKESSTIPFILCLGHSIHDICVVACIEEVEVQEDPRAKGQGRPPMDAMEGEVVDEEVLLLRASSKEVWLKTHGGR